MGHKGLMGCRGDTGILWHGGGCPLAPVNVPFSSPAKRPCQPQQITSTSPDVRSLQRPLSSAACPLPSVTRKPVGSVCGSTYQACCLTELPINPPFHLRGKKVPEKRGGQVWVARPRRHARLWKWRIGGLSEQVSWGARGFR